MTAFTGAKLALLLGDRLLASLRDDKPGIPWPNHWDLPGGGREGDETPEQCALRELREEFGIALPRTRLRYARPHPSVSHPGSVGWFFGGHVMPAQVAAIRFGDEGQGWRLMPVAEFLSRADVVPYLQDRLRCWLADDA